jgi:TadE-like protein
MIRQRRHRSTGGQALVEFALVIGLFLLVVGGIIQFATILWSQNTVNQIARDTARWAVTQSNSPCDSAAMRTNVATHANQLASQWQLIGPHAWTTASMIDAVGPSGVGVEWYVDEDTLPPEVEISEVFPTDCPPSDNRLPWFVRIRISQAVPIFFPGLQFISQGCAPGFCVSSTTELRMEPKRPE